MTEISIFVNLNKGIFVKRNQKPIMKYRLFLLVSLLFSFMSDGWAAVVSEKVAVETATKLLTQRGGSAFKGGEASVEVVSQDNAPVYYIIRYEKGGWALISAEDTVDPLLGYSFDSEYVSEGQPQSIKDWLGEYTDQIKAARRMPALHRHYRWAGDVVTRAGENDRIEAFIPVEWDQDAPYNALCPEVSGGPNGRAYVGCVAVAMGQALTVVRYPLKGTGTKTYVSSIAGQLSVNFDEEPAYNWDAILKGSNNYSEVARLLYHCGVLIDMEYGADGSGAITDNIPDRFRTYYGFPETCVCYTRDSYKGGDDAWHALIQNELKAGRAVIYAGNKGGQNGHCFNLDGWDGYTSYHVNWGWGGFNNGMFTLDNLGDGVQGSYPDGHRAVVGVAPKSEAPYGIRLSTTRVRLGTPAGTAVADVTVLSDVPDAKYDYELSTGQLNAFEKPVASGYEIRDNKLYTLNTVSASNATSFRYLTIKVTNKENGSSYSDDFVMNLVEAGAVDEVLTNGVKLYPVPAEEVLNLETPDAEGQYAIYNVAGMLMQQGDVTDCVTTLDVSGLSRGSYMLRYATAQGVVVKPFIVK